MVRVFRRSLSFPTKINPSRSSKAPPISHQTRSVSLPCRSHPLISHLNDDISHLRSWFSSAAAENGCVCTSDQLLDGLLLLKDVHETLAGVLQLPQTRDCLNKRQEFVEQVLEDLLRFVDAYGIFHAAVLALREQQASAQVAIRRKDEAKISLFLKSRSKISKEISALASSIRRGVKRDCHVSTVAEAELAAVIGEVLDVTVTVSVVLFNGVNDAFGSGSVKTASCVGLLGWLRREKAEVRGESLLGLRKKKVEEVRVVLRKMREMEEGVFGIENGCEKVFRSLITTRVSLLNILTL